jgi:predicted secreted protein
VSEGGAIVADPGKDVALTDSDNNTKINLQMGGRLTLQLEAAPGTGFSWTIACINDEQLKQQGQCEFLAPDEKTVGARGTQVLRFSAENAGSSGLELHYKRSFENNNQPAKIFKITVQID